MDAAQSLSLYNRLLAATLMAIFLGTMNAPLAFAQAPDLVECQFYSRPTDNQQFRVGDRITLVANVQKPNLTKAIGVATGLHVVQISTKADHVKYTVKARPNQKKEIERVEKINKLMFHPFRYDNKHDAIIESEDSIHVFLNDNPEYRPSDHREWGYGVSRPSVKPPKFLTND